MVGIYKIKNKVTEDFYIGSSSNCRRRKVEHFSKLRNNKHKNQHLQRAFIKYGEENFDFVIIAQCPKSRLLVEEQKLLDELKPKYNNTYIAGGFFLG